MAAELRPYTTLTSHYYLQVVPMFVTGAVVVTWLADEMTNYGIGGGVGVDSLKCLFDQVVKKTQPRHMFDAFCTVASRVLSWRGAFETVRVKAVG